MKRILPFALLLAMLAAMLLPVVSMAEDVTAVLITPSEVLQTFNDSKNSVKAVYKSSEGTNLPYRLYVPDNYDPNKSYPLVLFLHGAGERGDNNDSQVSAGSAMQRLLNVYEKAKHPCIILAPQCSGANDNKWVLTDWTPGTYDHTKLSRTVSPYMQATEELLDKVIADYSVDENRLYVTGMSMGGFGTWDIISRNPNKFAAAIPVCGGVDESYLGALIGFPIWTFHNDGDTIVSSAGTKRANEILGGTDAFTYTEFKSNAHDAWTAAYKTEGLTDWLFAQVRQAKATYPTVEGITFEGPASVEYGTKLSVKYTAENGYGLKSFTVGGKDYTISNAASGTIEIASFEGGKIVAESGKLCNVTVKIEGEGSLQMPNVFVGDEIVLPIEAKDGYKVSQVKVADKVLEANDKGEYVLKADSADIALTVTFVKDSGSNVVLIVIIAVAAIVLVGGGVVAGTASKKKKQ